MPARVSRANTAVAPKAVKDKRRKSKRRGLDAYERAQEQVPEERGGRSHRLGEVEDDGPRRKRRREEDEEDDDEDEDEQPRRKKSAGRSDDPDVEYGSDSSGNEWTMGGIGEDDDDSDLDSDEAFGESDEEKFGGFTFRGSKSSKKGKKESGRKQKDVDLDERSESEEDDGDSQDEEGLGLGDDAVDLAAMLDDEEEDEPRGKIRKEEDTDEESGSEEDEESLESEDDEDDDGDDEERVARMRDRLEALDSSSRKPSAPPQSAAAATVDDFLEDTGLDFDKPTSRKKKSHKPTTIAAPLPKRQQNKLDREVATEKAKQQLDRWRDTVVRNRRAEFLSFPLQSTSDQAAPTGTEKFVPATQEAPQNELEQSIQRIMEESGLAAKQKKADADDLLDEETSLLKAEELAEKQLPVEEVLRRRQELRRQRELLFREEIKAKRIAKIKSKSYRRVHRRERERDADREKKMLEEMGIDPEEDEDEKERADRKRAEARMGTKHKDSKWAKSLKQTNRTAWDENARDGVVQQAKRAEDLKKRIAGQDVSDDEGSDLPSDDDDVDLSHVDDMNNMKPEKKSGLAGLKFMQDAEERKRKANEEDVTRLRKDMAIADGDEVESEEEQESLGRAIFGPQGKAQKPKPKEQKLEFEAPEEHSDEDETDRAEAQDAEATIVTEKRAKQKPQPNGQSKRATASGPLANGWLREEPAPDKNAWLTAPKGAKKSQASDQVALEVSVPEAGLRTKPSKTSTKPLPKPVGNSTAPNTNGWTTVTHNEDEEDEEPQNAILSAKEASQTLQQRAFAGDDVETAFEAEKADLAESEDEKEVSNHLPGWGSWAGEGLTKSIRKANARARHNPLFKTKLPGGVKQADRKDANLDKVIVSEKQDRKGKKYLAPVLPHGFETREQYERSTRLPMGPEWSTKEVHQRMTKPKVILKKGVNVRAIEKPVT